MKIEEKFQQNRKHQMKRKASSRTFFSTFFQPFKSLPFFVFNFHYKTIEFRYTCSCRSCNTIFLTTYAYVKHMRETHPEDAEKPFMCSKCPKSFARRDNLRQHEATHLPSELRCKYPCTFCNEGYSQRSHLKRHIQRKHSNDRPFTCEGIFLILLNTFQLQ